MKKFFKASVKAIAIATVLGGTWMASAQVNGSDDASAIQNANFTTTHAMMQNIDYVAEPGVLSSVKDIVNGVLGRTTGTEIALNEMGLPVLQAGSVRCSIRIWTS